MVQGIQIYLTRDDQNQDQDQGVGGKARSDTTRSLVYLSVPALTMTTLPAGAPPLPVWPASGSCCRLLDNNTQRQVPMDRSGHHPHNHMDTYCSAAPPHQPGGWQ